VFRSLAGFAGSADAIPRVSAIERRGVEMNLKPRLPLAPLQPLFRQVYSARPRHVHANVFRRNEEVGKSSHGPMDHWNLRQVVCFERLWETRGSRLPLRGVIRLRIGIGSLWNLDGPRRRHPTARGRRAVSAKVPLIRKKRGCYAQGFDLCFHFANIRRTIWTT
jgi:hypothetical protein